MSASARSSGCHTGDVSSLSQGWTLQAAPPATASQRESPSSSISPLVGMASHIASSASMMTTPNPISSASYFEGPNNDPLSHMSFTQVSASSSPSEPTSLRPHQDPVSKSKESHDSKRIKVEGPNRHKPASSHDTTPPMNINSLECAAPFDEDPSHFKSFEIDYSKVYGPTGQARFMTGMTPRLGNGFYTAMDKPATFTESNVPATIEEDFLDDNAFEQGLSDDEESPENMDHQEAHREGDHLSITRNQEAAHQEEHLQEAHHQDVHHQEVSNLDGHHQEDKLLRQSEAPAMGQSRADRSRTGQLSASTSSFSAPTESWDESQLAMPASTMGMSAGPMWASLQQQLQQQQSMQQSMQRQSLQQNFSSMQQPTSMPMSVPTTNPASNMFALTPEERRRLIEIALGPSGLPTFYPPSRFNFNMPTLSNEYLYPPMQQANPISMRFGIGNDPAALRLLSTDGGASESSPAPHPQASQGAHPHPTSAAGACYPGDRDGRERSKQQSRPHSRIDATGASVHARTGPAPSRRMLAEASAAKGRSAERVAHNDVERKYRTNLRDKIAELRNAVPVLRQAYDAERSSAAANSKVSKGTVLTKATEYIHHLEQRNRDIMSEHQQLTQRLQAFETLLHSSLHAEMIPSHSMTLFDPRGFC